MPQGWPRCALRPYGGWGGGGGGDVGLPVVLVSTGPGVDLSQARALNGSLMLKGSQVGMANQVQFGLDCPGRAWTAWGMGGMWRELARDDRLRAGN